MKKKLNRKEPVARLSLEVTERTKERINTLMELTESTSMTEVIRRALAVYETVAEHVKNKGVIVLKNNDGTEDRLILS